MFDESHRPKPLNLSTHPAFYFYCIFVFTAGFTAGWSEHEDILEIKILQYAVFSPIQPTETPSDNIQSCLPVPNTSHWKRREAQRTVAL